MDTSQSESNEHSVTISLTDLDHIFRNAPGHLPDDTPQNRQLLIDAASDPDNYLGKDKYNNEWYSKLRSDGTQIWVKVRHGVIRNGGVNQTPRTFNPVSGLSGSAEST